MTLQKLGFACKYSQLNHKNQIASVPEYNTKTTTVAWLNRQSKTVQEQKLWALMEHNIASINNLVTKISTLEEPLRMVRLSSDILPVFTHEDFQWFWTQRSVIDYAADHFSPVGDIAKSHNVKLSFHPGQFCCLASDNPDVVERSISEFEYHATMAEWMGYGTGFHDHGFKINVHVSGRLGTNGLLASYKKLSPTGQNLITIENDEMSTDLDTCLRLRDTMPIVLDLHHHFISCGEYIDHNDGRIRMIQDSWRGCRPTIHYSVSREDILVDHDIHIRPNLQTLLESGHKKQKLRAHSDFMWNNAVNEYAKAHWSWADIMIESKGKNLASFKLYESWHR